MNLKLYPTLNRVKKASIYLFLALYLPLALFAQKASAQTVSGQVKDSKNNPLSGVSIIPKGTNTGTTFGTDGHFEMNDIPVKGILVFSYTGFATQEVAVNGRTNFSTTSIESASSLDEVVVVGYGTQRKKDVTGAVSQVRAERLENENLNSVQDLLRGNIAGLNVSTSTSAKGGL